MNTKFCKIVVLGGYIKSDVFGWFGGKDMVEMEIWAWI